MTRMIMATLDGSPQAEFSLPWAAAVAQQSGAELRIIRVHLPPIAVATEGFVALYPIAQDDTVRASAEEYMRHIDKKVRAAFPNVTVTPQLIDLAEDKDVADTLADYAHQHEAHLVVMTTHGRGAFARFWLGSVADEFLRHSGVPTLMVRPPEEGLVDFGVRPKIQQVLVPLDGSPLAEKALTPALELAKAMAAEITLLMVFEPGPRAEALPGLEPIRLPEGWLPNPAMEMAKGYLDRVSHDVSSKGVATHTKLEVHGTAVKSILHFADMHADTVIAVATHGRSGLTRMLMGSVADKVIRGSHVPVLVYRPLNS